MFRFEIEFNFNDLWNKRIHSYFLINVKAPEVICGKKYGFNFDWWGFGNILYEMLFGYVINIII